MSVCISVYQDRWEKAVCDLDNKLQHIVGDVMVSSAFITYCGPLTADFRKAMVKKWLDFCHNMEIPISPQYTFTSAMTEKNQVMWSFSRRFYPKQLTKLLALTDT